MEDNLTNYDFYVRPENLRRWEYLGTGQGRNRADAFQNLIVHDAFMHEQSQESRYTGNEYLDMIATADKVRGHPSRRNMEDDDVMKAVQEGRDDGW